MNLKSAFTVGTAPDKQPYKFLKNKKGIDREPEISNRSVSYPIWETRDPSPTNSSRKSSRSIQEEKQRDADDLDRSAVSYISGNEIHVNWETQCRDEIDELRFPYASDLRTRSPTTRSPRKLSNKKQQQENQEQNYSLTIQARHTIALVL
jgi:hypothetical protein